MDGGTIGILNVGAGDTKLTFDPDKPEDRAKAARAVADMLKRGYAILIAVGEHKGKTTYVRCDSFDPETCEYIISGVPPEDVDVPAAMKRADPPAKGNRGRRNASTRVKAEGTSAVSVARSAGG